MDIEINFVTVGLDSISGSLKHPHCLGSASRRNGRLIGLKTNLKRDKVRCFQSPVKANENMWQQIIVNTFTRTGYKVKIFFLLCQGGGTLLRPCGT